jgi:hypothetical protein
MKIRTSNFDTKINAYIPIGNVLPFRTYNIWVLKNNLYTEIDSFNRCFYNNKFIYIDGK